LDNLPPWNLHDITVRMGPTGMFKLNRFLAVAAVAALVALASPAWAERVRVTLLLVCDI
jgi:hypothetical protein